MLVADSTLLSPLADEDLRGFVLTVVRENKVVSPTGQVKSSESSRVCRVDEVAPSAIGQIRFFRFHTAKTDHT